MKNKILSKIEELYNKYSEENWNGYSASPIKKEQKEIVKYFIKKFPNKTLKLNLLNAIPEPCGEIWLVWITKNKIKKLTFAISKEKKLTYSFKDRINPNNNVTGECNLENYKWILKIIKLLENVDNCL